MHLQGIVPGMSNAAYHAHPAISKSKLDLIARSPYHLHAELWPDDKPEREQKEQFKIGTLAHCQILEPETVQSRYALRPDDYNAKTNKTKEWLASLAPGVIDISKEQLHAAACMDKSIRTLPDVASALMRGQAELSVFYTDPEYGDLKIRPDWVHDCGNGGVILVDLKTTADACPRQFARSVVNFRYHVQAAFYSDVYEKATGQEVLGFFFAVVESAYPYAPACYMLDEAAMRKGRALYMQDLQLLKHCREKNEWPAFGDAMQFLELPAWATNEY